MSETTDHSDAPRKPDGGALRTGFTTGACATAAAAAALGRLLHGVWEPSVTIALPRGGAPAFEIADRADGPGWARAGVVKDAGDDPDVTHGALIRAEVREGPVGGGVQFRAGEGVGLVTRAGLPIPPGEPAINPVPRRMITETLSGMAASVGAAADYIVTLSAPGGAALAEKTWNPRLGIVGGLSILGTTGIVRPFSCAAWIASIHRGVDVARAGGAEHVIGSTGATSEAAAQALFGAPDWVMLDMGDFAGGMLKYLARNPVPRVTIAGGPGKLAKLAQGDLDLHSKRSQVDFAALAARAERTGAAPAEAARVAAGRTVLEALEILGPERGRALAGVIAADGRAVAAQALGGAGGAVSVIVASRSGAILADSGFAPVDAARGA